MSDNSASVSLTWSGQTRQAVASAMLALHEMGDVSKEPWNKLDTRSNSGSTVKLSESAARATLDEMKKMQGGYGREEVHAPTLKKKAEAIRNQLNR